MTDKDVFCNRCRKWVPYEGCRVHMDGDYWTKCPITQAYERDEDTWGSLEGPITDADEERTRGDG